MTTEDPEAQLCKFCERWPLRQRFFPPNQDDLSDKATLRPLHELQANSWCPMCRFSLQALSNGFEARELEGLTSAWVHYAPQLFGSLASEPAGTGRRFMARIWLNLSVNGEGWSSNRMGTTFGHGMQVSAQVEDDESQNMLLGRSIGDTHVDRTLMSKWLCCCVENHGEECTPKIRKQQPDFKLRVIDVYGRCVIEAPEGCSYVALSYVWGVSTQLCLVKEHYARLEKAGGLADCHADVPDTVKDAMYLCEKLGERYLWVDSLCIKQDDRLDRRRQIDNMDQVYSCATLTIVAAGADSVNANIPGVRPNTRKVTQYEATVNGLHLTTAQRPFLASVAKSKWNSRGWTFEEKTLSKRLLIFTPHQAFFRCEKATYYEDAFLEDPTDTSHIDISQNEGLVHRKYLDKPSAQASPFHKYSNYAEGFARRDLTKETDGLNAFKGILNILRHDLSNDFIWGMPETMLDTALTWMIHNHFPDRRRTGFPSWSWVGWRVGLNNGLDAYGGTVLNIVKEIEWYVDSENGNMRCIGVNHAQDSDKTDSKPVVTDCKWKPERTAQIPPLLPSDLRPGTPPSHILRFWSSHAKLHVDRAGVPGEHRHGNDRLVIRDAKGTSIGLIYLHREWRQQRPDNLDFIVICRYAARANGNQYGWKSGLLTIVVEWDEYGVATRVQRSLEPIDEEVWAEAEPEWELVSLA